MSQADPLPLPPGRGGPPIIGETLRFLKDGLGFVERGVAEHGPVFRTSLLGKKAAVISGPEATALFNDETRVARRGGMPPNVQTLFAGEVLPALDGEAHRERKHFVLSAFSHEALESYVPKIRAHARRTLAAIAARGETQALPELQRFTLATILDLMLDVSEGPTIEQLLADYPRIIDGLIALPVPLPGTAYTRAKKALARALAAFGAEVERHRAAPRDDGLGRILAARSPRDGRAITDEEAKGELHHVVIAGFIVWCWLVSVFKEIGRRPELFGKLRAEALALPADAGFAAIDAAPLMSHAMMEVMRHTPVLPIVFGKAATEITFEGHRIPKGWMILWGWSSSHHAPSVYRDPASFEPERFAPPRSEHAQHPCAFAPQGSGDVARTHKCVGYELAPLMAKVFVLELLRGYEVQVPEQDWSFDKARLPPAPRSRVLVRLGAR